MRDRTRITVSVFALLAVAFASLVAAACEAGVPPLRADPPEVEAIAQDADSISYQATWPGGRNPDGTLADHEWETGPDAGGWTVTGSVPAADSAADGTFTDTFTVPRDSGAVPAFFCVEAVNAAGSSGSSCAAYEIPALELPPSAPGSPTVEPQDSVVASRVEIWPDSARGVVGDTIGFVALVELADPAPDGQYVCAGLTDGRRGWREAARASSPPNVDLVPDGRFVPDDCLVEWETTSPDSVVPIRTLQVFQSDSLETGVRWVDYGFATLLAVPQDEPVAMGALALRVR